MAARALIVDDHPIIRGALVAALVSLSVFDQVETVDCFRELREKLEQDTDYQLMILDLSLTDISGPDGMIYIPPEAASLMGFKPTDTRDSAPEPTAERIHS